MSEKDEARKQVKPTMQEVAQAEVIYDLSLHGHHMITMAENGRTDRVMGTKTRMPELLCSDCGLRIDVRGKSKMSLALSHNPQDPERAWDAARREQDLVAFLKCELVDGHYVAGDVVHYARIGDLQKAAFSIRDSNFPGPEGNRHYINWAAGTTVAAGVVKEVEDENVHWVKPDLSEYVVKVPSGQTIYAQPGDFFAAGERLFYGSVPKLSEVACNLAKAWDALADLASEDTLTRYAAVRALAERTRTAVAGLNADYQFEAEKLNAEKAAAEGWRSVLSSEQLKALEGQIKAVEAATTGALDKVWMANDERFQVRLEALLELCRLAPERYVAKLASQIDRVRVPAFKAEILAALGEVKGGQGGGVAPSAIAIKVLNQVARSAARYPDELRASAVLALGAQSRGDLIEPFLEHSSLALKKAAVHGMEEAVRRGYKVGGQEEMIAVEEPTIAAEAPTVEDGKTSLEA